MQEGREAEIPEENFNSLWVVVFPNHIGREITLTFSLAHQIYKKRAHFKVAIWILYPSPIIYEVLWLDMTEI